MALFQKTVLKEFVKAQNQVLVQEAFEKFQAHFGDPTIQQNILKAKEEQYQEGFLKDLFVNILGYTLYPQPNHNLITEQKNEGDSKKADGAILKDEKVVGVIELKAVKDIKDLETFKLQAFSYKNAHQNCRYVITSNFKDLWFYLDNTIEKEEFDLFNLDLERFKVLYTLLHQRNIAKDLPLDLKQKSIQREQEITLAFYNDYEAFRESLFKNIAHLNRQYDKLLLFQKTQKLLDRIVFMCFAQDKGLLPANLIHTIIKEWETRKEEGDKISLYDRFKAHFEFINTGFQSTKYDIYPYNGGLFAYDEILDKLQIDDKNLRSRSEGLSSYDFDSDVDVNVLGHIFEHSLNQLDKKRAELIEDIEGEENGKNIKQNTKRKVDGIFYTPLYITNYIIEETLGKLCEEKRKSLDWDNLTIEKINKYRDWLLTVKVLDPACGSGAFLNQVLNFFINEHQKIDEWASIVSQTKVSFDLTHQILENNIFGVDINFESVSITKLSLWLRIAQDKRKLNDLSENIKQGNSLIDDPSIDERAFDWKKEFPKAKEGFDLIVGNPPYVDIKTMPNDLAKQFFKLYETAENRINLYALFIERSLGLLKTNGILSFIVPNSLLVNSSYLKLRQKLYQGISQIIKLPDNIFKDANVETIIFKYTHNQIFATAQALVFPNNQKIDKVAESEGIRYQTFNKKNWNGKFLIFNIYANDQVQSIIRKCFENGESLEKYVDFSLGITPYDKYKGHSEQMIKSRSFHAEQQLDDTYKPLIAGENIIRFLIDNTVNEYIKYGDWLGAKREERFFTEPRIIVRQILSGKPPRIYAGYTDKPLYFTQIGFSILPKNEEIDLKFLLALINSKLMSFVHKYKFTDIEKEIFGKILIENCRNLPIKIAPNELKSSFINLVNILIAETQKLENIKNEFSDYLKAKFKIERLRQKLDNYFLIESAIFLEEIKKSKISLTMSAEKELLNFFKEEKQNALSVYDFIQKTEKEIDSLVYKLYDLTEEEIKIVENG
ncbi:MAG: TaqI-like C-terminal specificity domain-containing protein [Thermoflexibacter sp.]